MKKIPILFIFSLISFESIGASDSVLQCKNIYPSLNKNNHLSNEIIIEADQTEMIGKEIFNLKGNVQVDKRNYSFNSDKALLDTANKSLIGTGNVSFLNDFLFLQSKKIEINDKTLNSDLARFSFIDSDSNGTAEKIIANNKKTTLFNTTYSNCNNSSQDWFIKSSKLVIDDENNRGVAKDATLSFFGLPILYHPELSWPLRGRGSGFLSPTLSKYEESADKSSQYKISVPYYFNIAKDRDLLLKVENLPSRGTNFYSKYRQLLNTNSPLMSAGNIEIENQFLGNDKISKRNRWLSKINGKFELKNQTSIQTEIYKASDKNYFADIFSDGSSKRLLSYLDLSHSGDADIKFRLEDEQLINNGESDFLNFPKLEIRKKVNNKIYPIDIYLNATNFKNKDSSTLQGQRFHLETSVEKNFSQGNFLLSPIIKIYSSKYRLENNNEYDRLISNVSLNAQSYYHNNLAFENNKYLYSLKPKFTLNYTQDRKQDMLPNFDSEKIVTDSYNIFDSKIFSGLDRINNDQSLTYGIDSTISDVKLNGSIINFSLAQKYFFNDTTMNVEGLYDRQRNSSNIFSDLSFLSENKKFIASISYDPYDEKIDMSSFSYNYQESPKKLLGLTFIKDEKESIKINSSYPINKNLHLFGSVSKFLNSNNIQKSLLGFSYETCCWEARLVKTKSDRNLLTNSLDFELVFKDLTSTSPMLKDKIKQQIPNYLDLYE